MSDLTGTVLGDIVARRRAEVALERARKPLSELVKAADSRHEWREFARAIASGGIQIIAEIKQASPSRGLLRSNFRVRELAQGYEAAGAAALSVLTEEPHFRGSLTDLIDARDATGLPVLRKDFTLEEYQVVESAAAGADALLLIVAALSESDLRSLIELTQSLRLEALVEVHTEEELKVALNSGARILGVNNRDLKTLKVDLQTSFRLRHKIPAGYVTVSESGIKSADDLLRLKQAGYHAALIGEQFMTAEDPGEGLATMLKQFGKLNAKDSAG